MLNQIPTESELNIFVQSLLEFDKDAARTLIENYKKSENFIDLFSEIVSKSLETIGQLWECGSASLSQVYLSGRICEELVEYFFGTEKNYLKKVNAAIVTFEDHHNLGKILIKSAINASGYQIDDLGSGLGANEIFEVCQEKRYDLLMVSTLMLDAALNIATLIRKIKKSDLNTKVIVGGAPFNFNPELWQIIGADGSGTTPGDALNYIKSLIKK